jgi:N6-adenosine-specific RNA methylase IME4
VILADPPWQYDFSLTVNREIENHYPTMTLEEIKAVKVPAAKDAVLFLWVTAPKLVEGLEVMSAWGFEYRTCAAWDKEVIGMGYWFRNQHELLLVGTRGNPPVPAPENRFPSVIRVRREDHSKKPDIVYEMIEKMLPEGKYLELFARQQRTGWTAWGNECDLPAY